MFTWLHRWFRKTNSPSRRRPRRDPRPRLRPRVEVLEDRSLLAMTAADAIGVFDPTYYILKNPDVSAAVQAGFTTPLTHFLTAGQFENRNSIPLFHGNLYLIANPDVAALVGTGQMTGVEHFAKIGQFEGRNPGPLFDTPFYLGQNPDVAGEVSSGIITAYRHFVSFGQFQGRSPNALFDQTYYVTNNPEVSLFAQFGIAPHTHFDLFGQFQQRDPSSAFNTAYYLEANPDVAAVVGLGMSPIEHYLQFGILEGRLHVAPAPGDDVNAPSLIDLGPLGQNALRASGSITDAIPFALYRFTLDRVATVTIDLTGLSADADLQLLTDLNGNGLLDVDDILADSINADTLPERIAVTLQPGTYFVHVYQFLGETNFDLGISAGDNTIGEQDLGVIGATPVTASGAVSTADPFDRYRFTLSSDQTVTITLTGLQADADVVLMADLDGDGQFDIIASSENAGSDSEQIVQTLSAGTYRIEVYQYEGDTSYVLGVSGSTPSEPIPPAPPGNFNDKFGFGLVRVDRAVGQALGRTLTPATVNSADTDNAGDLNLIQASAAWAAGITGQGVVVAVIDTGSNFNHFELSSHFWTNAGEVPNNGRDDDGNGFVDDVRGWDFINDDNDPTDDNGHGTHVAGTIAAASDGTGTTGVAFGSQIMTLKVLDAEGSGRTDGITSAINYAAANGANVINMSLGGGGFDTNLRNAVANAAARGVVVVIAAGNESAAGPAFPGKLASNIPAISMAVGAVDRSRAFADFSNGALSDPPIQNYVVAPGVDVISASYRGNGFQTFSGTSMASPHVAGVAALIKQANPNLTASQIIGILNQTADPTGIRV